LWIGDKRLEGILTKFSLEAFSSFWAASVRSVASFWEMSVCDLGVYGGEEGHLGIKCLQGAQMRSWPSGKERERILEIWGVEWIVVRVVRPEMMVVEDKEGMVLGTGACPSLSPFISKQTAWQVTIRFYSDFGSFLLLSAAERGGEIPPCVAQRVAPVV
jgi:hypothetical protein